MVQENVRQNISCIAPPPAHLPQAFEVFLENIQEMPITHIGLDSGHLAEMIVDALDYPILDFGRGISNFGKEKIIYYNEEFQDLGLPYPTFMTSLWFPNEVRGYNMWSILFSDKCIIPISYHADQIDSGNFVNNVEPIAGSTLIKTENGLIKDYRITHSRFLADSDKVIYDTPVISSLMTLTRMMEIESQGGQRPVAGLTKRQCSYGGSLSPEIIIQNIDWKGSQRGTTAIPTGLRTLKREHVVRGHWRRYRSGKRTFIESHKRGDSIRGRVITKGIRLATLPVNSSRKVQS